MRQREDFVPVGAGHAIDDMDIAGLAGAVLAGDRALADRAEANAGRVTEQGQLVIVRQRTYTVTDVTQSSIATGVTSSVRPTGQHLIMLSSIEDDALGEVAKRVRQRGGAAGTAQNRTGPRSAPGSCYCHGAATAATASAIKRS